MKNNYEVYKEKYKALSKSNQKLEDEVVQLKEKISRMLESDAKVRQ